ncbi:type II toxin-antitoxin system RelE/ParE family toxin [Helicobacter sp. 13S00401-1]|uniref:type II toxin-antitoxin system RelE/ParE family toxin n=1 Tax=Helicobacter sp. 13S00401-1 TaxID=1905758 RepID=UPI00155456AE|nr:type II toxin-antitoxin system RelE/ParE family toxin [Helicobacter sp. 13S00401-1]
MRVIFHQRFNKELETILIYIYGYSPQNSKNLNLEIKTKIKTLTTAPYIGRIASYDNNIRELIHKGYVIPYNVDKETVVILGIYGANKWSVEV